MPCWPAYSNWRASTSSKNNPNHRDSPPAHLSSPTPTMKSSSSVHRPNGEVTSSSHYDTPPWRVDQPNGASINRSSPSGVMNRNTGTHEIGVTRNPAFYEPDVTSWKIGPPLLSPERHTAMRPSPLTTHCDNSKQSPSTNGYSQTNGISPISRRFENGNQIPFLDNHTLNSSPQNNGSANDSILLQNGLSGNVSHIPRSDGYAQINRPYQTSTMHNNGNRDPYRNNFIQELSPGAQTTDSMNHPVYTYSAPNGTAWVSNTPLNNQNGPMPFTPVRTNGSVSPIPTDHNGHAMNTLDPMQTTRSDAPTLGSQNNSTLSPFEPVRSPRSSSPISSNQNGDTITPVETMRTIRSRSPNPSNHNGWMKPTFATDRTTDLSSPILNHYETPKRNTPTPTFQGRPKTSPSEWAYRPANAPQHERFRTLPPANKTYGTGPRNETINGENVRSHMTIQKHPNSGSKPNKIVTTTERPTWNSNTVQNGHAGHTEKILVTEDEYRFGREIKLSTSRFASHMNLPTDYFDKIFEDAGMPDMPDLDMFGITYPSPKRWPSSGDDRRNTRGSSGYDSPSFSPSLPSPFSPPHQPDYPNSYQPQSPYDPTIYNPSTPKSLDTRQPSQPVTTPIKGRSSREDKKLTGPGIDALKEKCFKAGQLYRDHEFPAESKSLYYSRAPAVHGTIEWKRPFEICNDPQFVVDDRDRFDVVQGQIGNCWLVAAIAGLTLNKKLLERVCPVNQSFDKTYAGVFHFRFWRFGKWVEVVVDDRLPTVQGRLVYLHSSKPNEFWSALTEKAYAKIIGTYEALDGGITSEGVTDFTGGIVESLSLRERKNPWGILLKAFQKGSIMGCGIDPAAGIREQELANGLVCGHAYTITCVKQLQLPGQGQPLQLVRLRNPWGSEHEWKGAWSDRSSEWQCVPHSVQAEMGLTARADGEFWMSFDDFRYNFHTVDLCHLPPDATEGGDQWQVTQKDGAWVPGISSGGCGNYQDTFHINPQYRVRLSEPDDGHQDGLCTMIISMTQKNRRKKASEGAKNLTIGYSILKAPVGTTGPLDRATLRRCETVGSIPSFINSRDISYRHELPPGEYVIIPSTFTPHVQGEFLLRIYTEKTADHQELDEKTDLTEMTLNSIPSTPVEKKREEDMMNSFDLLAGEDGEIDAWELKKIVTLMFTKDFPQFEGFGIEAARSMIAMHDGDMTGKLGRDEFVTLYNDLNDWKKAFKEHDVDEGGTMDIHELRRAFKSFGFRLSNRLLVAIGRRYANKAGVIDIQDFMLCSCRLKTIIKTFQANKTNDGSTATFPMDEFMTSMMYS